MEQVEYKGHRLIVLTNQYFLCQNIFMQYYRMIADFNLTRKTSINVSGIMKFVNWQELKRN